MRMIKHNRGFTITELMIATAVFSVLLLLSLAGFLQIGQLFYKGVNITQTSDVANQVVKSLKNDISFDPQSSLVAIQYDNLATPPTERGYFCAGSSRYGFILGKQLDREAQTAEMRGPSALDPSGWHRFALLKDKLGVSGSCPNPFLAGSPNRFDPNTVTELLGDKMRISNLAITQLPGSNNKLYTISITVAYGDDEVLENPNDASPRCLGSPAYSKYCFVTSLRTVARKGLEP